LIGSDIWLAENARASGRFLLGDAIAKRQEPEEPLAGTSRRGASEVTDFYSVSH